MSALSTVIDLARRLWLLFVARIALRRAPPIERLSAIDDPGKLARAALPSAARRLSLAVALLPKALRREATLAALCCRALDAHEDLAPDPRAAREGVLAACAYLTDGNIAPFPTSALTPRGDSDRVEALLAARLPLLRAGLDRLPAASRGRIHDLLRAVARAMADALTRRARGQAIDWTAYCDGVLGQTIRYAVRLTTGGDPPSLPCRAAARVLQLANNVRDVESDRARGAETAPGLPDEARARLLLQAAAEAPLVPRLLRALAFPSRSGARGATALLAVSTAGFFLRQVGLAAPSLFNRPLIAGLFAALSPSYYLRIVATLERVIRDALPAAIAGRRPALAPRAFGGARAAFEEHLACTHLDRDGADALAAAATLLERSGELTRAVGDAPLEGAPDPADASAILAGDHLFACALASVAPLGPDAVRELGELAMSLSSRAQSTGESSDGAADTVVFLSRLAGRAASFRGRDLDALAVGHRTAGRALCAVDAAGDRASAKRARAALAGLSPDGKGLDSSPAPNGRSSPEVRARLAIDLAVAKKLGAAR